MWDIKIGTAAVDEICSADFFFIKKRMKCKKLLPLYIIQLKQFQFILRLQLLENALQLFNIQQLCWCPYQCPCSYLYCIFIISNTMSHTKAKIHKSQCDDDDKTKREKKRVAKDLFCVRSNWKWYEDLFSSSPSRVLCVSIYVMWWSRIRE